MSVRSFTPTLARSLVRLRRRYRNTNFQPHFRKAKIQVTLGDISAAVDSYSKGLRFDPNNAPAIKEKEEAKKMLQRMELALSCLDKYENNMQKIEGRQALSQIVAVLGTCPGWRKAKVVKCRALYAAGKIEEALSLCTSLMRSGGAGGLDNEILFTRARCLKGMGDMDDAVKHYKMILQGDPDNAKAKAGEDIIESIEQGAQ